MPGPHLNLCLLAFGRPDPRDQVEHKPMVTLPYTSKAPMRQEVGQGEASIGVHPAHTLLFRTGWPHLAWQRASSSCCCCSASTGCSARGTMGSPVVVRAGGGVESCPAMTMATRRLRRRSCRWCCEGTSW